MSKSRAGTVAPPLAFTEHEVAEAARVVAVVGPIVVALAGALAPRTEVVLHDLTKLPGSIAAIGGSITGREVGGPATDLGLRTFSSGWKSHLIGYRTETYDGRPMRSSSLFFHASTGRAVACLCLNTDVQDVLQAQELLRSLSAVTTIDPALAMDAHQEHFPTSVDDLAQAILQSAVTESGIRVESMKKRHKVEIVRRLRDRGFFAMREAAPIAAKHLGVGRHTIYNYLRELDEEADAPS